MATPFVGGIALFFVTNGITNTFNMLYCMVNFQGSIMNEESDMIIRAIR